MKLSLNMKIIMASFNGVPSLFLIWMIFTLLFYSNFFKFSKTIRISFLEPITIALNKSLTLNLIRSIFRETSSFSNYCPTLIKFCNTVINFSAKSHDTSFVLYMAYFMTLASCFGTYFCFLYVV